MSIKNVIIMQCWSGKILFEGHFKDKMVDKVLEANRCPCRYEISEKDLSSQGDCLQCDDTGYCGDFEVYWIDDKDERNVYEYINY